MMSWWKFLEALCESQRVAFRSHLEMDEDSRKRQANSDRLATTSLSLSLCGVAQQKRPVTPSKASPPKMPPKSPMLKLEGLAPLVPTALGVASLFHP